MLGTICNLIDPVDCAWYGPIAGNGKALISSSVWGSWGDKPWHPQDRRKKLAAHLKSLRKAGFKDLAKLALAHAKSPSPIENYRAVVAPIVTTLNSKGYGWSDLSVKDLLVYAGLDEYVTSSGVYRRHADGYCRNQVGDLRK